LTNRRGTRIVAVLRSFTLFSAGAWWVLTLLRLPPSGGFTTAAISHPSAD
jgi:hypothetical protein